MNPTLPQLFSIYCYLPVRLVSTSRAVSVLLLGSPSLSRCLTLFQTKYLVILTLSLLRWPLLSPPLSSSTITFLVPASLHPTQFSLTTFFARITCSAPSTTFVGFHQLLQIFWQGFSSTDYCSRNSRVCINNSDHRTTYQKWPSPNSPQAQSCMSSAASSSASSSSSWASPL